MRSFIQLYIAAVREFRRDFSALFWTFAFPIIFIVVFGIIFSNEGDISFDLGVVNEDGAASQQLVDGFEGIDAFDVSVGSREDELAALEDGARSAVIIIPEGTGGLLFQTSGDLKDGFVALLTGRGAALENLAGKVMWEDTKLQWKRGEQYVVEGEVMTDRVAVRVLAEDGKTVLSECPAVYVPDTNNSRTGYLGLTTRGGPAEFAGWGRE